MLANRRNFVAICGWFTRPVGLALKAEMAQFRERDHRLSESRIVEDALRVYLPTLRAQLLAPTHEQPAPSRRRRAMGE